MGQVHCQSTCARSSEISLREGTRRFVSCRNAACIEVMNVGVIQAILQQQQEDSIHWQMHPRQSPHSPQSQDQSPSRRATMTEEAEPATRPFGRRQRLSPLSSATPNFLSSAPMLLPSPTVPAATTVEVATASSCSGSRSISGEGHFTMLEGSSPYRVSLGSDALGVPASPSLVGSVGPLFASSAPNSPYTSVSSMNPLFN